MTDVSSIKSFFVLVKLELFRRRFCISPTNVGWWNVGKAILHRIIGMVWDKYSDEYECIFIPQIYAIMVKNTLSNWKK